jgi:hypothetical protein
MDTAELYTVFITGYFSYHGLLVPDLVAPCIHVVKLILYFLMISTLYTIPIPGEARTTLANPHPGNIWYPRPHRQEQQRGYGASDTRGGVIRNKTGVQKKN